MVLLGVAYSEQPGLILLSFPQFTQSSCNLVKAGDGLLSPQVKKCETIVC